MFSNTYPLSNTGFINLGRAKFLCDLIIGALVDIYAHIFQTIGKTAAITAAQMCLPFCSLIMKIVVLKGVHPPRDGIIIVRQCPISMLSFQMSKSHSSAEQEKKNLSKTPKSESIPHVTPFGHGLVTHTTNGHTKIASPLIFEPQTTSTQLGQSSSHANRLTVLVEGLHEHTLGLANVIYSTNSKFKCVSQPLRKAFSYSCQKGGEQLAIQIGRQHIVTGSASQEGKYAQ